VKPFWKYLSISLFFLIMAALLRYWIAPFLELLPANYSNRISLTEEDKIRDSPTAVAYARGSRNHRFIEEDAHRP